jgi:hypothetical protein
MKIPSIFLMFVGCVWALFVVWMFLALAGITDFAWSLSGVLYWILMLTGPVMLIVGSYLVLIGASGRSGVFLAAIACLVLTGFVLYISFWVTRYPTTSQAVFYAVVVVITFLADVAFLRIVTQRPSLKATSHR